MFYIGILLLVIGAVMVYGTTFISRIFGITSIKSILFIKIGGLVIAFIGGIFLFFNNVPERLNFLRIIRL